MDVRTPMPAPGWKNDLLFRLRGLFRRVRINATCGAWLGFYRGGIAYASLTTSNERTTSSGKIESRSWGKLGRA